MSAPTPVPTKETKQHLNPRQEPLLRSEYEKFFDWMLSYGKDPEQRKGLSAGTAENYLNRFDQLFRVAWTLQGTVTLTISTKVADEICEQLKEDELIKNNGGPYSEASKIKFNNSLRKYFEYHAHARDGEEWNPPYEFSEESSQPSDYLTREERRLLRGEALEYDVIPSYSDCTPEQRDNLKQYLSQKLGKPKNEVTPEDWKQHNQSWERTSLLWISMDAGLRPIEVERATIQWPRPEKATILIPKEESCKNRENWEVSLREQTAEIVKRWLEERKHLEKYEDTDALWLTREGNPWESSSLNYLLRRLCDDGGIDRTNRKLTWYSLRHSVGQHMSDIGGIEETKAQLRHKSIESTLRYANPSAETRRSTLDKMG